jgi:hypothetical protein
MLASFLGVLRKKKIISFSHSEDVLALTVRLGNSSIRHEQNMKLRLIMLAFFIAVTNT